MAKGVKTGGRKAGTPNKVTADIKALAQEYGADAISTIVGIMNMSENDTARLAAAKELIDRGYGKASQAVEVNGEVGLTVEIIKFAGDSE
jgi:hypothetical protein